MQQFRWKLLFARYISTIFPYISSFLQPLRNLRYLKVENVHAFSQWFPTIKVLLILQPAAGMLI